MRHVFWISAVSGLMFGVMSARADQIQGDYVEARTADVFTGPCFSNAEVFIYGNQGVAAWKINKGSFNGVDLAGLMVAAAIQGQTTFSEDRQSEAKSVLIVDENADSRQREALIAFAKSMTGKRLENIVSVRTAPMGLTVESHKMTVNMQEGRKHHGMPHAPRASFWAPGLAEISTRPLDDTDHLCGNEAVAYAPLSKGVDVLPAYTLGHKFQGIGLGGTWNDPNARSAFVGHFSN
ncbi:MAG: DUF1326 domain-containing protein [Planctomycetota bacterium]|nr:MAG: DUF1326 domain-containing protein [Planctomycetota bacterium]